MDEEDYPDIVITTLLCLESHGMIQSQAMSDSTQHVENYNIG